MDLFLGVDEAGSLDMDVGAEKEEDRVAARGGVLRPLELGHVGFDQLPPALRGDEARQCRGGAGAVGWRHR